jgi:hypothetical protein
MKLYYTVPKIHEVVSNTVSRKATKLYPVYTVPKIHEVVSTTLSRKATKLYRVECPKNSRSCIQYTVPKIHEVVSSTLSRKFTKLYPVHYPENPRSCIHYTLPKSHEVVRYNFQKSLNRILSGKFIKLCLSRKSPKTYSGVRFSELTKLYTAKIHANLLFFKFLKQFQPTERFLVY